MIFYLTGIAGTNKPLITGEPLFNKLSTLDQEPFYFLKEIPVKVKLFNNIDLSFFRNRQLVSSYRYKIILPGAEMTTIDQRWLIWSDWDNSDFVQIKVPELDQEGGYKLMIEYKSPGSDEVRRTEKLFYVYFLNPLTQTKEPVNKPSGQSAGSRYNKDQPAEKTPDLVPVKSEKKVIADNKQSATVNGSKQKRIDYKDFKADAKIIPDLIILNKNYTAALSDNFTEINGSGNPGSREVMVDSGEIAKIKFPEEKSIPAYILNRNAGSENAGLLRNPPAFNSHFTGIITKSDPRATENLPAINRLLGGVHNIKDALKLKKFQFYTSPGNSSDITVTTGLPENLPSVIPGIVVRGETDKILSGSTDLKETSAQADIDEKADLAEIIKLMTPEEDMVSLLSKKGISLNETDKNGNSSLHLAILLDSKIQALRLINNGAELNALNNLELAPLHLAVIMNENELVKELASKGADINLKGSSGFTPLHIASELNYPDIAMNLLLNGAKKGIRNNQNLTPVTIAKIQKNNDIISVFRKRSSDIKYKRNTKPLNSLVSINPETGYPSIEFNLPFEESLTKKRHFSKIVQVISVPVLTLSSVCLTFLKKEANHYYDLSKIAPSEDIARDYYDKTRKYDKYSRITIGISVLSAYGLIHSTIRKRNISDKMAKTFNN